MAPVFPVQFKAEYPVHKFAKLKLRVLDDQGSAALFVGEEPLVPEFPADLRVQGGKLQFHRRPPHIAAKTIPLSLGGLNAYKLKKPVEVAGTITDGKLQLEEILSGRKRGLSLMGIKMAHDHLRREQVFTLGRTRSTSLKGTPFNLPVKRGTSKNPGRFAFDLVPFVLPSPYQADANSCLYMAVAGAAELGFAAKNPTLLRQSWTERDLSERFLMNRGTGTGSGVANWRTDLVLAYNQQGGSPLNRDYPFTMGWYAWEVPSGYYSTGYPVVSEASDPTATYGAYYNWIDEVSAEVLARRVSLPPFNREVIYKESSGDLWAVARLGRDHLTAVQDALMAGRPVTVIYNHFGYWHATLIVGFSDHIESSAEFVDAWLEYMSSKAARLEGSGDPQMQSQARSYRDKVAKVAEARLAVEDIEGKGVFWVRDSIYPNPYGAPYDYDPHLSGEEENYTYPLIERDYTWLLCLASHAVAITW